MDFLNLPSLEVTAVIDDGSEYLVSASPAILETCPHCGGRIVGFGRRPQNYADLPLHRQRVTVRVVRRRWRCRDCQRVSVDPLPAMDEKHEATRRLVEYVREQAANGRKKTHIAREAGLGEKTVRDIVSG